MPIRLCCPDLRLLNPHVEAGFLCLWQLFKFGRVTDHEGMGILCGGWKILEA
jgi:hypothetical protein